MKISPALIVEATSSTSEVFFHENITLHNFQAALFVFFCVLSHRYDTAKNSDERELYKAASTHNEY